MADNNDKTESVETYVCTNPKFEIKASATAKASVSSVSSTSFSPSSSFTFSLVKPYSLSVLSVTTAKTIGVDMTYGTCSESDSFNGLDFGNLRTYGKDCNITLADDFAIRSSDFTLKNLPDGKNTAVMAACLAAMAVNGGVAAVPSVVIGKVAQKNQWKSAIEKAVEEGTAKFQTDLTEYDKKKNEKASSEEWMKSKEAQDLRKNKLSALLTLINGQAKTCAKIEREREQKKKQLEDGKITQKEYDKWDDSAKAEETKAKQDLESYKKAAEELAKEIGKYSSIGKSEKDQKDAINDELKDLNKKIEAEEYDGKINGQREAEVGDDIVGNKELGNTITDTSAIAGGAVSAFAGVAAAMATFINAIPPKSGIQFVSSNGPLDINIFPAAATSSKFELSALAGAGGNLEASVDASNSRNMTIQANNSQLVDVRCGSSYLKVSSSTVEMGTNLGKFILKNAGKDVTVQVENSKMSINADELSFSAGGATHSLKKSQVSLNGSQINP